MHQKSSAGPSVLHDKTVNLHPETATSQKTDDIGNSDIAKTNDIGNSNIAKKQTILNCRDAL